MHVGLVLLASSISSQIKLNDLFAGHASASQVKGPRSESRWEHSSFLLKSPDFVPVAPRVAFSGMGQARIENNLKNIYFKNVMLTGTPVKNEGRFRT